MFFEESKKPGDHSGEETPVPIPNTEVKLPSADGTARGTVWESRSSPGFFILYLLTYNLRDSRIFLGAENGRNCE